MNDQTFSTDKPNGALGIFKNGFGLEIRGEKHLEHVTHDSITHGVFLHKGTSFVIRIYNINGFTASVCVRIDGVLIGSFVIQPFSKCDINRPIDAPVKFLYGGKDHCTLSKSTSTPIIRAEKCTYSQSQTSVVATSIIQATFEPEKYSKTFQAEFTYLHRTLSCKCFEVENQAKVSCVLSQLTHTAGDEWKLEKQGALLQWSTPEYDSAAEFVYLPDDHNNLVFTQSKAFKIKKFSLIQLERINLDIMYNDHNLTMTFDSVPTINDILTYTNTHSQPFLHEGKTIFIISSCNRLLCSSSWKKQDVNILNLMHRDELTSMSNSTLNLVLSDNPPGNSFSIVMRMHDRPLTLYVNDEATVGDCRIQMYGVDGPSYTNYDYALMYNSCLLENGHTLLHYDIPANGVIDVIKKTTKNDLPLQMTDPIVVMDQEIDTTPIRTACYDKKNKKHHQIVSPLVNKKVPERQRLPNKNPIRDFIQVNPIEVDSRYSTKLEIYILPKEQTGAGEECVANYETSSLQDVKVPLPKQHKSLSRSTCILL